MPTLETENPNISNLSFWIKKLEKLNEKQERKVIVNLKAEINAK